MKKSNRKFLYACSNCETTYTTVKQASSCAKPISKDFKVGDIVKFNGRVWRITSMNDGIHFERLPEWILAFGWQDNRKYQSKTFWWPYDRFCKRTDFAHFSLARAKDQMKLRVRQAEASQKFFKMLGGKP